MSQTKAIKSALLSVYYKDGLAPIVKRLHELGVTLYSTGGTEKFIRDLGIPVVPVEDITSYPSIFGGRVKTLHPAVMGGILHRRDNQEDLVEAEKFAIPPIDLVVVDLYPFEETVASGANHQDIIEKIDIGGISLIRAAAKNYKDVVIVPGVHNYAKLLAQLAENDGAFTEAERRAYAKDAFQVSSHYDSMIFEYFDGNEMSALKISADKKKTLRYGENPHQEGAFFGDLDSVLEQLHGKELSYNNLLDVDAAMLLIAEFDTPTIAVIKHNNACGVASREKLSQAWEDALAGDPVSAFGGVIVTNRTVDAETAAAIDKIFFEVILAPGYETEALEILQTKKNRVIVKTHPFNHPEKQVRTILNGLLVQDRDSKTDVATDLSTCTALAPSQEEIDDLLFASKICKHTKSNTIVLAKNKQLLASGTGQTSRVDALRQAIAKAKDFGFDLKGAVMASDAFFPFPDCVEIANEAGVSAVIQPGGSIRDKDSIAYCNTHQMKMVLTGTRHFKH
ncbi:MAG: bifunctional phosphoribosylaminoimidazolecarboxamide formyltransferase/IMP cyclohydrolase [Schleiferiaceae bacterium]|nr:bifunctional phosphoribosylaminoimidazolecarboxamide formyltransferase/IMP cyclohydrolase [Schleiferiaceae bacterium]